ncbi:hypothetical protein CTA2_8784 [Colletotrichum tanaceti]|uniref:Plastocyanin-like domain-containing protein n=1 Tax=Colletotrichum tanaceti TaxID=1306861 RepID=A0A4U6XS75_9PEZI|nr:hypothetical protein CTA2_8784 [Colletotrichum tanaceti]TKW58740.1 hypothetical protein CTA1_3161 [Colletotrichum tanaceti]
MLQDGSQNRERDEEDLPASGTEVCRYGVLLPSRQCQSVDIIFENGANVTSQHPFHKHNSKAFIIGTGSGGFPWPTVEDAIREGGMAKHFNLVDPPNRGRLQAGEQHGRLDRHSARQQVVLLEGVEPMGKIPAEMKDRVHSDFSPLLRYSPLD